MRAEVSELTAQNQGLNKTFMALAGERPLRACPCLSVCLVLRHTANGQRRQAERCSSITCNAPP